MKRTFLAEFAFVFIGFVLSQVVMAGVTYAAGLSPGRVTVHLWAAFVAAIPAGLGIYARMRQ